MTFDIQAAKQAGYSDQEIADYLGQQSKFDVAGARKAGYSDADIVGHLTQSTPANSGGDYIPGLSESDSVVSQIPRQLGLTVRAGLGGLGGIANTVLDPAVAGINAIAKTNLPLPSQAMERTLSRFLPTPNTPVERIAQAGARAMVPVAGSVQLGKQIPMLSSLAQMPGTQLFSAASGGASSQGAAEAGAGPVGQALAGLGGGVAGPTALAAGMAMGRAALRVPGSLISPFTQGGQTDSAARAFQSAAADKGAALDAIGSAPSYVPGVSPTTAEVANDRGLSALYKTLLNNPQTRGPLEDVAQGNDAARRAFLAQRFGRPVDVTQAESARDAVTTPMREAAFSGAGPVDTTPIVQSGKATLAGGAQYRGSGPILQKFVNDISEISDPQVLYNGPRKAINDALQGRFAGKDDPLSTLTQAELIGLRGAIDKQIESVAPGFQAYLEQHAALSRPIDAMKTGQEMTANVTDPQTGQLRTAQFTRQFAKNGPDIASMGAQGSDAMTRVNEDLRRANAPLLAMRAPGSDTVQNSAGNELFQRLLGHVPGGVVTKTAAKIANAVYSVPQDNIRNMILRGMIDPKVAAGLLSRPIPQRPDLTAGLLAKLLPISYGGLLGTISAQ